MGGGHKEACHEQRVFHGRPCKICREVGPPYAQVPEGVSACDGTYRGSSSFKFIACETLRAECEGFPPSLATGRVQPEVYHLAAFPM
jgi:hypothetical protein